MRLSLVKMNEVKIKNTTIDYTMVENICLALENNSKKSVRTIIFDFYWKLGFLSKFETLKSFHLCFIKQNGCFSKYNTSLTKVHRNGIELQKHKCATSCVSRDLYKLEYGLQDENEEICSLLEHKPVDRVSLNLDFEFL